MPSAPAVSSAGAGSIDPIELLTDAARTEVAGTPLGLYIHVPFCARRCGYCAFNTFTLDDAGGSDAPDRWVAAAEHEIRLAAAATGPGRRSLTSVYFGGGTPTMLTIDQLGRVLEAVRTWFDLTPATEVTVESNPDGLRPGQLSGLRSLGVTRVSFGMQSVSTRVLALLDRTHSPRASLDAVAESRDVGFDHISLDLIYGTPGETSDDWEATLEAAIGSGVDHVSAYALTIEPGTKLASRVRHGSLPRPSDRDASDRYRRADERLSASGFAAYEISNWSRGDGGRSRHNLLYWRNHNWWGIGPGAHSHIGGVRWSNARQLDAWAATVIDGRIPAADREALDPPTRRFEEQFLRLRLSDGLPIHLVDRPEALDALVGEGLVTAHADRVVLTVDGRLLADTVLMRLTA